VAVSSTSIGREDIEVFAGEILRRAEAGENGADDAGSDGSQADASTDGQDLKESAWPAPWPTPWISSAGNTARTRPRRPWAWSCSTWATGP
jgi:hypothetical protein